jgi:ubiquinone/menaquinone biosynthesis C-methylase UbiE
MSVIAHIKPSDSVLDVACGTGALSMAMSKTARHVTGIDLSEDMIVTAQRAARRKDLKNVLFDLHDASDLSSYADHEFEVAVTSMAVHQFDADVAVKILSEMKRIARRVIIVDYSHHMLPGLPKTIAWALERWAGGDHYRNFRIYMQKGGIPWFAREAGLIIEGEEVRSGGVFLIARCIENDADK